MNRNNKIGVFLATIGPGILVAATGVGAGDLAAASLAGSNLGVAVLWAVLVGAFLKFVLTEGLARWQIASGETLLEGCSRHLGRPFQILFLLYLLVWSVFVGGALMGACGATAHAAIPVFQEASDGKFWFGILHSLMGVVLVWLGGFKFFSRVMGVCIAVMFVTVLVTAAMVQPDWGATLRGLWRPAIPQFHEGGLVWTVALMGGVGGTLTVICYGYWIRESGREGDAAVRVCRVDLAVAYALTALFGVAMVIIGSQVTVEGKGAGLIVALAESLEGQLGAAGKWIFLAGAWGAVFSSLLGVWQSVPYVFADFCGLWLKEPDADRARRVATDSKTYRFYLVALAVVPIFTLQYGFQDVQKYSAVFGACFMPFLAFVLIFLNGQARWVGERWKNRPATNLVLVATLVLFALSIYFGPLKKLIESFGS